MGSINRWAMTPLQTTILLRLYLFTRAQLFNWFAFLLNPGSPHQESHVFRKIQGFFISFLISPLLLKHMNSDEAFQCSNENSGGFFLPNSNSLYQTPLPPYKSTLDICVILDPFWNYFVCNIFLLHPSPSLIKLSCF